MRGRPRLLKGFTNLVPMGRYSLFAQQIVGAIPLFQADFADLGGGVVNTTLTYGVGSPTFVRTGAAYTYNSAGVLIPVSTGLARSYYDPTTLQYQGFLCEGPRTNLIFPSEDLTGAGWTPTRCTISANVTAAPDNAITADKIVEDATVASSHFMATPVWTSTLAQYAVSVFAKAAERTIIQIGISSGHITGTGANARFTLSGAGIAQNLNNMDFVFIKALPNGWYRCICVFTPTAIAAVPSFLYLCDGTGTNVYDGNGVSGLFAWGVVSELGANASQYMQTVAGVFTRNADLLSYPAAGNINVGTLSGTILTESAVIGVNPASIRRNVVGTTNGVSNNRFEVRGMLDGNATPSMAYGTGATVVACTSLTNVVDGVLYKLACRYGPQGGALSHNGAAVVTNAGISDLATQAEFGVGSAAGSGAANLYGPVRRVKVWAPAKSDLELQALAA